MRFIRLNWLFVFPSCSLSRLVCLLPAEPHETGVDSSVRRCRWSRKHDSDCQASWSCFCSTVTRWSQSPRWHGRLTRSQESDNQTLIIQHVSHTSECNLETYARRLVVSDSKAPSKPFTLKTLNLNSSSSPAQYQGSVW